MRNIKITAFVALMASCSHVSDTKSIPLEISFGGDVGQTQKLEVALREQVNLSPFFSLAAAPQSAEVRIVVPRNVRPAQVGGTSYIEYNAEFRRTASQPAARIGSSSGRCLERRMRDCADQILKDLRNALLNN